MEATTYIEVSDMKPAVNACLGIALAFIVLAGYVIWHFGFGLGTIALAALCLLATFAFVVISCFFWVIGMITGGGDDDNDNDEEV